MTTCAHTDRLLQTIRVKAPGATDDMIKLELFNRMDEFFRRTSAWKYDSEVELEENIVEYDFVVPADSVVVRVMGVMHNGIPVPAANLPGAVQSSHGIIEPALTFPDGDASFAPDATDLAGGVFSYAIYRPDYITVTTPPNEDQTRYPLVMTLALTLAYGCLECDCENWSVPEWMWDTYFQDWLDGVLGGLYAMPAKPWSSQTHAVYHGRRWRNAMGQRKQEAMRGFTYNKPAWRFPRA